MSSSGSAPLQIGLSIRQRSPPPLIISLSSGNVLIFSPKLLRSPRTSSRSRRSVDFLSPIKVETRPTARLSSSSSPSSPLLPVKRSLFTFSCSRPHPLVSSAFISLCRRPRGSPSWPSRLILSWSTMCFVYCSIHVANEHGYVTFRQHSGSWSGEI